MQFKGRGQVPRHGRVEPVWSTRRGQVPVLQDPITYGYVVAALIAVPVVRAIGPGWLTALLR
jgi:hypothetical protein